MVRRARSSGALSAYLGGMPGYPPDKFPADGDWLPIWMEWLLGEDGGQAVLKDGVGGTTFRRGRMTGAGP